MVRQQEQHPGQIVAADADRHHPAVEFRQGAAGQGVRQGRAPGQVRLQALQLVAQRPLAHPGAQLPQRPLQRNILAEHRRQLLIEKGKFVVLHNPL